MAVPESEEVGFKRIALSASDYNASVPIKKRRFPLMQFLSSPSKEISSFHLDGNLKKNGQLSRSEGPTFSTSCAVTTSGLLNGNKNSVSKENKGKSNSYDANMVQSNIGLSRVRFQEPNVGDRACFNGFMECEEKSVVTEKYALHALPERPGLTLSSTNPVSDSLAGNKEEEIDRKKPEEKCRSSLVQVKERAQLSVGLKGHIDSDLVPERSDWNCLKQNDLEPVLLDLSLSKQGGSTHCVTGNAESDYNGSLLHSSRENWDLNTSMESWEGCASVAPAVQIPVSQTNATVGTYICSTEMVETDSPSGKQALLDSERRINLSNACSPSNDHLHLHLTSSVRKPILNQKQHSSFQLDLDKTNRNLGLSTSAVQFDDLNVAVKVAKLEPFVEGSKLDFKGDKVNELGPLEDAIVKREFDEQCNLEGHKSLNYCCLMEIVEPKSVKSESAYDSKHEALKISGNQAAKHVLSESGNSCPTAMPIVAEMTGSDRNPSRSTDLTMSNHSGQLTSIEGNLNWEVHQGRCGGGGLVNSEIIKISNERHAEDFGVSVTKTLRAEHENDEKAAHPLKLMNEQRSGLQGSGECSVSDEEKISISADMLEEDSYISEYESDGSQDLAEAVNADDNNMEEDYEDGEVREPMLETEEEDHACEKREVEHFDHGDFDDKKIDSVELPGHDRFTIGPAEQENKSGNLDVRNEDDVDTLSKSRSSDQDNEDLCVKELHAEENIVSADVNSPVITTGRSQFSQCDEKDDSEGQDTSSDQGIDGIQSLTVTVSQGEEETANTVGIVQNSDLALPNVKESVNSDDATKDVNGGSRPSRIINLARASTDSSPCKTKSSFVRSVLLRTDRELVPDVALKGANLQPRGRDVIYSNITKKISVDRHQDQSSWMNFTCRRGRSINRLDTRHRDWDFRPNFSPEIYSNQTEYRVPCHKYASGLSDAELDQDRYKIIPDGPSGGTSRHGRQLLDDERPFFFHGHSRRKSPGRRHGSNARGGKMVNRIPRDFSPNTCMDEGDSEFVGLQHGEKFTRNFSDETIDPMYPRPQPPYEVDRPFFRERRNFSFQRKGFSRIDSRSPVRSRACSPGQWFSSKRSDRFCGRRRSPNYRVDRMRSPDQRSIRGHMAARRHGFHFLSPPSNDYRDVGPARDRGHMRSIISNRNRTNRLSLRNRRYDVIDPRGRIENDEFFDGPIHSGQLNDHAGGDHEDGERRFNERHEPLQSFKPAYNDSDGERFHNNAEDCSRPFRFCAENDSRIS